MSRLWRFRLRRGCGKRAVAGMILDASVMVDAGAFLLDATCAGHERQSPGTASYSGDKMRLAGGDRGRWLLTPRQEVRLPEPSGQDAAITLTGMMGMMPL